MFADTYVSPIVLDPSDDADAVARLFAMQRSNATPEYTAQLFKVGLDGTVIDDLSASLSKNADDQLDWDSAANAPGSLRVTLDAGLDLVWGSDLVAAYQLVRSADYNASLGLDPATFVRFPLGHYVATSPGFDDLDASDVRQLTGHDKNYLLQNQITDAIGFDFGSSYRDGVQAVFLAAGLVTTLLTEVCDYPGDWPAKTLPGVQTYAVDGSTTYLDVINALLKASGCRQLYPQTNGRWRIEYIPTVAAQALRWRWAASNGPGVTEADLDARVVLTRHTAYSGDVWNAPNRWVFIQQGLTFQPAADDGSDGRYVVDNATTTPGGQDIVGRVVTSTQFLQASGQDDLVTQGDAIVADELASAEKISLLTAPWPAAGHFDVFTIVHKALPLGSTRRVQAQSWSLSLWGGDMSWRTNVAAML